MVELAQGSSLTNGATPSSCYETVCELIELIYKCSADKLITSVSAELRDTVNAYVTLAGGR